MRSAAFLHALEGMPADRARAWASKAGVVMDGRDKDHGAFVDIRGGLVEEAPFDPSVIDPPEDWNRDA